jgi:hypothetical protein
MDQQIQDNAISVAHLSPGIYRLLIDGYSLSWVKE